ncbi:MAG TPA: class I SAM-dependent methyltransferase, partial [Phycisphaerales bacterium]|nr:class I SAM-dependent methyltransferase [Phycisphaerales bacterium]
ARAAREHIYQCGTLPDQSGTPLPVWPSGITRERGEALRELALSVNAATCLETGFGYGMSASFLLEAALRVRSREGRRWPQSGATPDCLAALTSIDPGETQLWNNAGLVHLEQAGLAPHHRFFAERSERVLPRLVDAGERFDLAFIDGDHRFDGAMIDVFYSLRLVREGGLIVLDDAWMPSVQKCSAFFVGNGLCEMVSVWPSVEKQRLHALRPRAAHEYRVWDHFVEF